MANKYSSEILDLIDLNASLIDENLPEFLTILLHEITNAGYKSVAAKTFWTVMKDVYNTNKPIGTLVNQLVDRYDYFTIKGLDLFNKTPKHDSLEFMLTINSTYKDPIPNNPKIDFVCNVKDAIRLKKSFIHYFYWMPDPEVLLNSPLKDFYVGVKAPSSSWTEARTFSEPHSVFTVTEDLVVTEPWQRKQQNVPIVYVPLQELQFEIDKSNSIDLWSAFTREILEKYNLPIWEG